MCAASIKHKVGVDIELIKDVDPADYYQFFDRLDIELLKKSQNPVQVFYQLWTRKEALAKAVGFGVMMPIEGFSIMDDFVELGEEKYHITDLIMKGNYKAALCLNCDS